MHRALPALCCVLLVVLAGCSGGPSTETPAPEQTANPADTATPGTTTSNETPAATNLSLAVGERVDPNRLARAHNRSLQGESYTLEQYRGFRRVVEVNDSGLARITEAPLGTRYQTADVAYVNRTESYDDSNHYLAETPDRARPTGGGWVADLRAGYVVTNNTTVDGEPRYVLEADIDYADTAYQRTYRRLVVDERGRVSNFTGGTYYPEGPNEGIDTDWGFSLTKVGETTVDAPQWVSWLRDAEVGPATATRIAYHPDLDARLRVVGDQRSLEDIALRENGNDWLTEGFVADAAVSPVVNPVVRDRRLDTTMTVGYDEALLPEGAAERNISLFLYNESIQTYVQMNTTVDAAANTATASRANTVTYSIGDGPEETIRPTIAHPMGRPVVVAMHVPTWYEAWENARSP